MAVYANKAFYYPQQMRAQTSKKNASLPSPGRPCQPRNPHKQ